MRQLPRTRTPERPLRPPHPQQGPGPLFPPDTASGFRAYSRASLLRLNVVTQFSYCMETIIQAGNKRLRIGSVPVVTNAKTRESRLFKNTGHHMMKSASAIMRSYLMFKPYVIFATLTAVFGVAAASVPLVSRPVLKNAGNSMLVRLARAWPLRF